MANNKLKKFLFPTEAEYVPEINHNPVFNKTPIVEHQEASNIKRDMFGQIIKQDYDELESKPAKTNEPIRESLPSRNGTTLVFNPTSYEGAREIAMELTKHNTVIVNLESILKDELRRKESTRIIDYLCGVAFALQIEVEKINATTFLFK